MLGRFKIEITFLEGGKIRGHGGEAVHGFIINTVKEISEDQAQYLHNLKGQKPFSTSPILCEDGGVNLKNGYLNIEKGLNAKIIISTLNESTLGVVMKSLIDKEKKKVNIGGIEAKIEKVCLKENEEAKFEKYVNLLRIANPKEKVVFHLLTPLSFRQKGAQCIFPLPELVFTSLLQLWNSFSPVKIPKEIKEKFKSIIVSRFKLRSELWHFSKYKIVGAKGIVEYTFKDLTKAELKFLNALCLFANFSGVGYKRTMGMGMVEVQNVEKTS